MPLVSLTVKFFGQQVHTRFEKDSGFLSQITARAQENMTGVRVVRAYAQEKRRDCRLQCLNWEYAQKNLALVRVDAVMRPLMTFLIGLGFVLIIWVGVPLAVRGEITVGQFMQFNMYLFKLIWPLIAIGYVVNLYQARHCELETHAGDHAVSPAIADTGECQETTADQRTHRISRSDISLSRRKTRGAERYQSHN
jgi:ATP-binding cassette subfamily B protein